MDGSLLLAAQRATGRLLTAQEAADFLGIKLGTLLVWRSTGRHQIPAIKLGRNLLRFRIEDLQAWADAHREEAAPAAG